MTLKEAIEILKTLVDRKVGFYTPLHEKYRIPLYIKNVNFLDNFAIRVTLCNENQDSMFRCHIGIVIEDENILKAEEIIQNCTYEEIKKGLG